MLITDISIQKSKKPICFGAKSSNCFSAFPIKRRKDKHRFLVKFKTMEKKIKQKHPWRSTLYCLIVGKVHMVGEKGGYIT